jgi:hypothetical protein
MSIATLPGLELSTTESLSIVNGTSTIQILINTFLSTINETNWTAMVAGLRSDAYNTSLGNPNYDPTVAKPVQNIRTLITVADGTVAYDSSKGPSNTYANFGTKTINSDNHNTRPEILLSLLSNSGVGVANRYSTSVLKVDMNLATRFGLSTTYPLGCYRLSQSLTA